MVETGHVSRHGVIEAADAARAADADLIARIGGGSVTDEAKAVIAGPPQVREIREPAA
jgi:alcohol dehydrogenase class IV